MNLRHFFLALLCVASLSVVAASTVDSAILGQHLVKAGETLYCIGRGYGVRPAAIAEANGLAPTTRLVAGQTLKIPAVQWASVPTGPLCPPQFASPYAGAPVPSAITPTPTSTTPTALGTYVVRRGDTLSNIGRMFGVTVPALRAANNCTCDLIFPGDVILIPQGATPTNTQIPSSTPNSGVVATASVSNATPNQNTTVTVSATILVNGAGAAGIPVTFVWYYRTVTRTCSGVTDSTGVASCSRFISGATHGYTVTITGQFQVNGQPYRVSTSFTPR